MAVYVWFKHEGGGSASSFLLVNGEIDVKLVCQTFGLNEKESVRLGDLVVRIEGDGRVAYDRDEFGGKTRKDAVLVRNGESEELPNMVRVTNPPLLLSRTRAGSVVRILTDSRILLQSSFWSSDDREVSLPSN